jgi:hypothetical protein
MTSKVGPGPPVSTRCRAPFHRRAHHSSAPRAGESRPRKSLLLRHFPTPPRPADRVSVHSHLPPLILSSLYSPQAHRRGCLLAGCCLLLLLLCRPEAGGSIAAASSSPPTQDTAAEPRLPPACCWFCWLEAGGSVANRPYSRVTEFQAELTTDYGLRSLPRPHLRRARGYTW